MTRVSDWRTKASGAALEERCSGKGGGAGETWSPKEEVTPDDLESLEELLDTLDRNMAEPVGDWEWPEG